MKEIITAEGVSKAYRIGVEERKSDTMLGAIWRGVRAPVRNFRNLRNLRNFNGDEESVFWALKDINFAVREGEVLGIIGHNGAGKSTLLKILSRITDPTSGRILIKGRVSSLLEVGTGFHPDLTGRENIYMNGTILGMRKKEIDSKLDEIIRFSGISKHVDTPVKRYSSGMTVRLAFSVAAHLEPEILIIDEVLAVGDAEFQAKCLGKMSEVANQGRTVLFVSHNLSAVRSLCTRLLLLNKGAIVHEGSPSEGIEVYLQKGHSTERELPWLINDLSLEQFTFCNGASVNDNLFSGESATLSFIIQSENRIENPVIIAWVSNQFGDRVLLLSSRLAGVKMSYLQDRKSYQINIERLMLMPGSYFLNLGILAGGGKPLAYWENIQIVNVYQNPNDIVLSLPDAKSRGIVYAKYEFQET